MSRPQLKGGYLILEIPLSSTGFAVHSLYLKEHVQSSSSSSKTKTLFVGNVDLQTNMSHEDINGYLRELFTPLGAIESVSVSSFATETENTNKSDSKRKSDSSIDQDELECLTSMASRFAHVQFTKSSSVQLILQATKNGFFSSSISKISERWGIDSYITSKSGREIRACYPLIDVDRTELKRKVDQYMQDFEEQEQIARISRERASRQVDEDGFMPVQHRKKRKRQSEGRQGGNASGASVGRSRSNKKKTLVVSNGTLGREKGASGSEQQPSKELKNFYGFQQKEERQGMLFKLRQQFEDDKAKVAKLKQQRKFKPF